MFSSQFILIAFAVMLRGQQTPILIVFFVLLSTRYVTSVCMPACACVRVCVRARARVCVILLRNGIIQKIMLENIFVLLLVVGGCGC